MCRMRRRRPAGARSRPSSSGRFGSGGVMKQLRREALNTVLIAAGILSAGMGLKGFLLSSNFIDGGVTGVSMLLAKMTGAPLAVWLPLVNVPFIAVGYRHMG